MRTIFSRLLLLAIAALACCLAAVAEEPAVEPAEETDLSVVVISGKPEEDLTEEEKADADIGRSAAEEIGGRFKPVEDTSALLRLGKVVERLRPATQKPLQKYEIRIIDSKALNAFSLPGGYLYFMQGVLDAVESEDELAAIAAHEMAHVCLMHSRRLMSKDEKYQKLLGSLLVVSILSNAEGVDPGAIAAVGSLVVQDALNHYGREAELEADREAVLYLRGNGSYNPVAVLTVVEGLARMEASVGNPELGVYQTHPYGKERVKAVERQLTSLGVPIERRRVTNSLVADYGPVTQDDVEIAELRLNGRVVFRPAADRDGLSPLARAERSTDAFNRLLRENLQLLELRMVGEGDSVAVRARGEAILVITAGDAAFHGSTSGALAQKAMGAIRLGFSEEKVTRAY
jgi:predicted Zn-dependent protease